LKEIHNIRIGIVDILKTLKIPKCEGQYRKESNAADAWVRRKIMDVLIIKPRRA
jgi:hypothetical protein